MRRYRLPLILLLFFIILFGILLVDYPHMIGSSILPARYAAHCIEPGTELKFGGHVTGLSAKNIIQVTGFDDYALNVSYSQGEFSTGDEIVIRGYYDKNNNIFYADDLIKRDAVMKNRYLLSFIVVPIILIVFFREYKIKDFRFVRR